MGGGFFMNEGMDEEKASIHKETPQTLKSDDKKQVKDIEVFYNFYFISWTFQ